MYDRIRVFQKRRIYSIFVIINILFLFIIYQNLKVIFNPLMTLSFSPLIICLFLDNGIVSHDKRTKKI